MAVRAQADEAISAMARRAREEAGRRAERPRPRPAVEPEPAWVELPPGRWLCLRVDGDGLRPDVGGDVRGVGLDEREVECAVRALAARMRSGR
ncbi:MAG: hypothetical protein KGK07_14495 [Chloroflexota bacterium]|nr:hypothetical protein [Chloroflexota bacterium]